MGFVTYLEYNSGTVVEKAIYDIHSTFIRHNTEKQTQRLSYLCQTDVLMYQVTKVKNLNIIKTGQHYCSKQYAVI